MAGAMIPPDVLNRKSLFSLLYKIDQDLAERTRSKGCPFAGGRCIAPIIGESLGAVLLNLKRFLIFVLACAADVLGAGAGCFRHRYDSGVAGFTGHRCCFWPVPFVRCSTRPSPWSGSRHVTVYGVQPSTVGNATFATFLPKASAIDDWPGT